MLYRLFGYVARYRLKLAVLIGLALVGVGFEVLKPLPLKVVIDTLFNHQPLPAYIARVADSADRSALLAGCIGVIVFSTLGSALISYVVASLTVTLAQRLVYDLSVDLYAKLQKLSLSFYTRHTVGDLLQRMNSDVFVVYFLVAQILIPAITSLICVSAMFYVMATINLTLAVVALSVVPLLLLALAFFTKPMNDTTTRQYQKQGELSSFVQQSLVSMKLIQAFGRESFMRGKLERVAQDFGRAFQIATQVGTGYNQTTALITGLAAALLIGLGASQGMNNGLSAGDLYVFLGYTTALFGPVNALATAIGTAVVIRSRSRRVFEVLDSDELVQDSPHAKDLSPVWGEVEFRNVAFGYETPDGNRKTVLHDVNLRIEAGQTIAIVGPTGAGKTSLISLLSRFFDPWEGQVLLDGQDLRDISLHSLRENMAVVLQEPFLFPMTVAENIAFGNPEASFEEIQQAARAAQAHAFIERLPQGYDTVLSEGGGSLSGGERQRISLARAFLKKAQILILDEPTSALDAITEARIFEALADMAKDKTIFLISHRLSTIKHADQIITLKDGVVVESGTHFSLLERGEVYATMYKYQQIA